LVPLAVGFYAVMGAVALAWRLLVDGQGPFFATQERGFPEGGLLLRHALLGLLTGGALIFSSRLWTRYTQMGRTLAQRLAEILGPLSGAQVVVLALASGLGEEAFFRGALQPRVGLVLASLLFGIAHLVPRRELVPWAGFAVLAGVLLGALFDYTGNLLAPAVAHVLVNGINLRWLARASIPRAPGARPRSATGGPGADSSPRQSEGPGAGHH
jgi:membrane protease YdiL (CAAX protease family)